MKEIPVISDVEVILNPNNILEVEKPPSELFFALDENGKAQPMIYSNDYVIISFLDKKRSTMVLSRWMICRMEE